MARRCFYSFYYKEDNWRASKVRNIGAIEGNKPATDNDWETITKGGDPKIIKWIADQMIGRTCTVVLIGSNTAGRKWITHEIAKSWDRGMGVLGIHIHNITDRNEKQCSKGSNPIYHVIHAPSGKRLSSIVKVYDPLPTTSSGVYNHIAQHIVDWIEDAIKIRNNN